MKQLFYVIVLLWVGWLLLDGLRTGEIWARGGSKDRYTRDLDMHSFAHKVDRRENPTVYWLHVLLYAALIVLSVVGLVAELRGIE